jgi:hypothetical protein
MESSGEKRGFTLKSTLIQECIFLLACFFYLFLQTHPVLILELQKPVFFKGMDFLAEALKIPGGFTDWLSSFFMFLWLSDFRGALFLALCLWAAAFLTRKWIETLTDARPVHTYHLIPAGLLLVLHNQYDFNLSITLGLIVNLLFLVLIKRLDPDNRAVRMALGMAASLVLYWLTGGAFLIFTILWALDELLIRKQFANSLLLIVFSAALPYAAFLWISIITLRQAYLHNLFFESIVEFRAAIYAIPSFYLLAVLTAFLAKLQAVRNLFRKIPRLAFLWHYAIGTVVILAGTMLLAIESTNEIKKLVIQINQASGDDRWNDVLSYARRCTNLTPLVSSQTNLALYQTGVLLDSMFAYPQSKEGSGLLMNQTWCTSWPDQAGSLAWRLGLVNVSLHWAHEYFEHKGPAPDVLKLLGKIYMVKGDYEAASHFFLNLKNVPYQGDSADVLLDYNANPSKLRLDSIYNRIISSIPSEDKITIGDPSSFELELLLKKNPQNKMAFEYLLAYQLLNGNVIGIWNHLPYFRMLNYKRIPRHIQEALIVIGSMNPKIDMKQLNGLVNLNNINRFMEFRNLVVKNQNNRDRAKAEVQAHFSDTYWYYLMFVRTAPRQSETQNEYQ